MLIAFNLILFATPPVGLVLLVVGLRVRHVGEDGPPSMQP